MNREITLKLLVIIACFAVLTFCGRKRWLKPSETLWVGLGVIFWATGWLMATLVTVTVGLYGHTARALWTALALCFPMALALSVGLWFVVRRLRRSEASYKEKTPGARKSPPKASEIRKKK